MMKRTVTNCSWQCDFPLGSLSTCNIDASCQYPQYFIDEENVDFDGYKPKFFHSPIECFGCGIFYAELNFEIEHYNKDLFYFCCIHQFMPGQIKLVKNDKPIQHQEALRCNKCTNILASTTYNADYLASRIFNCLILGIQRNSFAMQIPQAICQNLPLYTTTGMTTCL